ncbi:MAG TPA: SUF system NifU family Fe-S cluster assembly protein [Acholeplasmataceae bacterium]|nr:SUF system NifU family Fe-S cluster assembly protein [Acholeplasmataceae bacterium]
MNLEVLYRQVIMDHYKNPRHKGLKGYPNVHLRNPSCGDDVTVEAKIENEVLKDVNHEGSGCSICCSSASVLCELMTGKTITEAQEIINNYYRMIKGEEIDNEECLEEALVYQGVSKFPARIKCATISWKALEDLIGEAKSEGK